MSSRSEYERLKSRCEKYNKRMSERMSEEVDAPPKAQKVGKAAPRRLYSARTKEWYEMQRALPTEAELYKCLGSAPTQVTGRFDLCMWLVGAITGANTREGWPDNHPATRELWVAPDAETELKRLQELLVQVILASDARLTSGVFLTIREKQPQDAQQKDAPIGDDVAKALLQTSDSARKTIAFLALHVRRPRLLRWFLNTGLVTRHARSDHGFTDDLAAIAVAINDCVFNPQRQLTYEESKAKWDARHTVSSGNEHSSDSTLSAGGWRWILGYIMRLVGDKLPHRVYEDTKRNGEPTNRYGPVSLLVIGIRSFEIDDTFLKHALRYKKWSESQLSEAMIAALSSEDGVRGPSLVNALVLLYHPLLECWKTNEHTLKRGVVCTDDTIAGIWRLLADKASGYEHVEVGGETGKGIVEMPVAGARAHLLKSEPDCEDVLMRHPQEWEILFEHMIRAHANKPEDANSHLWDVESPFFASLLRQAILRILGDAKRTRLLGVLMKATDGCALVGTPPEHGVKSVYEGRKLWSWLDTPSLLGKACLHHVGLLPYLLGKMCAKPTSDSKETPPLAEFIDELHQALWLASVNTKRQACRLLVGCLKGGHMPTVAEPSTWNGPESGNISWLSFYVKEVATGADQAARDTHGDDYADFLNARIDADFRAVVAASDWDDNALDEALRFASTYNRPIAAAVLMSAPSLRIPDTDDAFLMAINAEIHAPGNIAAQATASNFSALHETMTKTATEA